MNSLKELIKIFEEQKIDYLSISSLHNGFFATQESNIERPPFLINTKFLKDFASTEKISGEKKKLLLETIKEILFLLNLPRSSLPIAKDYSVELVVLNTALAEL